MKKIGIVTFHCVENYGALLQAIALKSFIERNITKDVYVIDYKQKDVVEPYKILYPLTKYKSLTKKILILLYLTIQLPFIIKKKFVFQIARRKELSLITKNKIKYLDYIVCGSDQIWNPNITGGIDKHYYGIFDEFKGKKIIYAASDGDELSIDQINEIKIYFTKNEYISVREQTLYNKLVNSINYNILDIVVDPVFLLEKEIWNQKAVPPNDTNYILIYKLEDNEEILTDADFISKKTNNKKIIEIVYNISFKRIYLYKHKYRIAISPREFIGYFIKADYVLTNSFHGTAFSIIFEKNFFSYKLKKRQSRITDLLSILNLEDRYVKSAKKLWEENVDYDKVKPLLNNIKNKSIKYLMSALDTN